MLPPRLIRRLVLAPLVVVISLVLIALPRAGRMRSLRLTGFALIGLAAETTTLLVLAGLWVMAGFGRRLQTEPYQARRRGSGSGGWSCG